MNGDGELERRIRGALGRPRPGDAVDTDDFLSKVHHGAKVRRVKRGVSVAAAGLLAVTGGGLAINASGLLGGEDTPVASDDTTPNTLHTKISTDTLPPTTTKPSQPKRSETSPTFRTGGPAIIQISPKGPVAAKDVHPVSLTATGQDFQWVLAKTPGKDCNRPDCATIFATDKHGAPGTWVDVGQLPAPPATSDSPTDTSVSQLRFTKRADGLYDGWAFGNALWSTHDSGHSWTTDGAPRGNVTQLESWGTVVYAGASSSIPGDNTATLYRSPTSSNDWQPIEVTPKGLTSIQALAASSGLVALIDSGPPRPAVYLSRSGDSGTWQREEPCPKGTDPSALSSAGDATGLGSLWVTCKGLSDAVVRSTDTAQLGLWRAASETFGPAVTVAAQSPTTGYVAGQGINGIERFSVGQPTTAVPTTGFGAPVFFAFTNPMYGYLLDSAGNIVSTTDGGGHWTPYTVSDTKP